MCSTAGNAEIQLIQQFVPQADVAGVLRDGRGLLLEIDSASDISAKDIQKYEQQLLRAGVEEWTWEIVDQNLQIRAYWPFSTIKRAFITLICLTVFFSWFVFYYDIHLAKTARGWTTSL